MSARRRPALSCLPAARSLAAGAFLAALLCFWPAVSAALDIAAAAPGAAWSLSEALAETEAFCAGPGDLAYMTKDGCRKGLARMHGLLHELESDAADRRGGLSAYMSSFAARREGLLERHERWCKESFVNVHDRRGCLAAAEFMLDYGRPAPEQRLEAAPAAEEKAGAGRASAPETLGPAPAPVPLPLFAGLEQKFDQPRLGRRPGSAKPHAVSGKGSGKGTGKASSSADAAAKTAPDPKTSARPQAVEDKSAIRPSLIMPPLLTEPGAPVPGWPVSTSRGFSAPSLSGPAMGERREEEKLPPVPPIGRVLPPVVEGSRPAARDNTPLEPPPFDIAPRTPPDPAELRGPEARPFAPQAPPESRPESFSGIIPNVAPPPAPPPEGALFMEGMPAGQAGQSGQSGQSIQPGRQGGNP